MASFGRSRTLSETSSDDEATNRSPLKKRRVPQPDYGFNESNFAPRSTVIVSPSKNTALNNVISLNASSQSSSQGTDSSEDEDNVRPSIHQVLIKPKEAAQPVIDQKAKNMMAKMGFKEGTGLGKNQQGMVKPIEVSKQRGRRGLGLQIKGLEAEEVEWDSSKEIVEVEETVEWFPTHDMPTPTLVELRDWIVEGEKKHTIDDEVNFCQPELLQQVLECKTIFDRLEPEELRVARSRSNPFETIRGGFFLNRAAMKMANMDAVFGFIFTNPKMEDGSSFVSPNELLYFADVCAGPGGFSEYILWKKKWEAKGFGFTLKGSNDFKLEDFFAAPSESFEPHYGVQGIEGDGDVYKSDNIREFRRYVMSQTEHKGVHFMMADGGFSVEGQENIQEILSKRLYLCQFLVALAIVRPGGHFVCKLFDVFTPFSAGLIYLMYRAFKCICLHKPNTSRPANSERYIVCKWKRDDTKGMEEYLFEVNGRLEELDVASSTIDILEIVPLDFLLDDRNFTEYLTRSNNVLASRQVVNLAKIAAFCKDVSLREDRQSELKKQSLEFWRIPDKARTAPPWTNPMDKAKSLLGNNPSALNSKCKTIADLDAVYDHVKSVYDWRCVVLGLEADDPAQTFYLGLGRNNVYRWDAHKSRWQKVPEVNIEMARDSLVYAELVQELRGEGRSQKRTYALHIIDAVCLGGVDISQLHLRERYDKCRKFAKSMNKPSRTDLVTIRAKENFKLEEVDALFSRLVPRILKNQGFGEQLVFALDDNDQRAYRATGLLLYKATKQPWMLALSRSSGRNYWYHCMTRQSVYDCPKDSITTFFDCHNARMVWWWRRGFSLQESAHSDQMSKDDFISCIHRLVAK